MVGGGVLRVLGKYGFDIDFDIVFRKYMVEIMEVVLLLFFFFVYRFIANRESSYFEPCKWGKMFQK